MADLFCNFLDIRSLSTNYYYKLHLSCHCKNLSSSLVHSYNSRTTTRRRKSLNLTFCSKPSSPNLDVISTHEHRDGSLLFRFGDPSEVVENVNLEKFDNVTEEEERGGEGECSYVKVFDDDHESEVIIEKVDELNLNGVSGRIISVVESEIESAEKLSEGSKEIELPVSVSSVETKVSIASGSEPVSISSAETKVSPAPDLDIQINGYSQDTLDMEIEDSSPADVSVLDNMSEMETSIATTEPSEKENTDATIFQSVSLKPENNDSQSGAETAVTSNMLVDSELENMDDEVKSEIILDRKESDTRELLSDSPTCLSEEAECENSQVTVQNVVAGSGSESDTIDVLTVSPHFESAINLSAGAEVHSSKDGTLVPNDIVIGESESDMIQLMPVSPQLEKERKLDDETIEKNQEDQFIVKDQSESDTIVLMPASPQLGTESKLDDETDDNTVVKTQEDQIIVKDQSESDLIALMPASPQLGTESKLDDETDDNTVVKTQEDQLIVKDQSESESESESDTVSSQLEMESMLDDETGDDTVVKTQEDQLIVKDQSESDTASSQLEPESKLDDETGDDTVVKTQEDQLIVKDQSESDTVSSQLEPESKLDDETGDDTVVKTQEDQPVVKDQSESDTIQLMPVSLQLGTEPKLDDETGDDTLVKTQEDQPVVKDQSESDTIELMPVSPQLGTESKLDNETDADTVVQTQEDQLIVKDQSESDTIQLTPVSSQLETEPKLDDEASSVEKAQEDQLIVKDQSESDTVASQLEMESKLDDETGEDTVGQTQEDQIIVEAESESDMVELMPVSPLETESKLDEEIDVDTPEESREDIEVQNTPLKDGSQDLITATERTEDGDNMQVSELLEASGNEVTEPESTESATNSEEIVKSDFVLSSGAALLPHPSKVLTGGEDAYFVAGQAWIGVADGVGQWSLDGTNPGVYAQDLIRLCEKLVSDCDVNLINNPVDLLNLSVVETRSRGSSTVLIARFDGQTLHVANIGDSGFIILRHGTVYKRSSPMLHLFHFPIQIERGDDPSHVAEFYQVDLEEEDVIIIATDGLLDNLYNEEISSIVLKSLASDMKLEEIAEMLAKRAQEVGTSAFSRSPFADNAQAAGYVGYTGGKLDDVTVIVSVVERTSHS